MVVAAANPHVLIRLQARVVLRGYEEIADRLKSFIVPLRTKGVAIIRSQVQKEFRAQAWFMPSGGTRPWAPVKPFGNKARSRPLMDSGAYLRALTGQGPGSVVKVGPRSVQVGVDGAAFPYAQFLRGGSGATIRLAAWVIKPKARVAGGRGRGARRRSWAQQFKLWWKLGLEFGVWLKESTLARGLRLPTRPHLTRHPELTRRLRDALRDYLLTGSRAA